jgi:hypothetical protein
MKPWISVETGIEVETDTDGAGTLRGEAAVGSGLALGAAGRAMGAAIHPGADCRAIGRSLFAARSRLLRVLVSRGGARPRREIDPSLGFSGLPGYTYR